MTVTQTLSAFARNRERALTIYKALDGRKSRAITNILRDCDHFQKAKDQTFLLAKLETDIIALLPSENSRYQKLRTKILNLLQSCKK